MAVQTAQPGCLGALATDTEHAICIALFVSNWQPYLVLSDTQPSSALHFALISSLACIPLRSKVEKMQICSFAFPISWKSPGCTQNST